MVKELLEGKLGLAPIGDTPQKILDLGTGCGIWAIEGESLAQTFSHLPLLPSLLAFFLFLFLFFQIGASPLTMSQLATTSRAPTSSALISHLSNSTTRPLTSSGRSTTWRLSGPPSITMPTTSTHGPSCRRSLIQRNC